jgi:hypothetical protein
MQPPILQAAFDNLSMESFFLFEAPSFCIGNGISD